MTHTIAPFVERNKSRLIRVGIVCAILLVLPMIGVLTAEVSSRMSPVLIFVPIVALFGIMAVGKHIELSIIAMLLAAVFFRYRIPTGTASEIVISLVICAGCIGLWVVRMLVEEKRLSLKPASINAPLLAFMATVPISWVWSRAFRDALVHEVSHPLISVAAGLVIVLLPACLLLVANNVRDLRWLQALVWVLLGEGLIVLFVDLGAVWGVAPIRSLRTFLYTNGFIHLNTQGLLSMWCLSFAMALALFNRRLNWLCRSLLLVYAAGWVYWGFSLRTSWLAGWVPAFAAGAVVAFLHSKKLFAIALIVVIVGAGGYYWRTSFEAETEESGYTRLAAYEVNWRITSRHLLFGTGPASYASYYMSYFPTEAMASHSNYIDIVAQTGIVGLFFFLWFFGAQAWGGYKLRRELRGQGVFAESVSVAVLAGTAGCVVAMALGDWVTPFAYTQGIVGFDLAMLNWLFMGSLWALRHIESASQRISDRASQ